jgi:hypothetical protein
VSGNTVTFIASITQGGQTSDATVTATVEGNSMRGTVNMPGLGNVEFTGSRPQKGNNVEINEDREESHDSVDHP